MTFSREGSFYLCVLGAGMEGWVIDKELM